MWAKIAKILQKLPNVNKKIAKFFYPFFDLPFILKQYNSCGA